MQNRPFGADLNNDAEHLVDLFADSSVLHPTLRLLIAGATVVVVLVVVIALLPPLTGGGMNEKH